MVPRTRASERFVGSTIPRGKNTDQRWNHANFDVPTWVRELPGYRMREGIRWRCASGNALDGAESVSRYAESELADQLAPRPVVTVHTVFAMSERSVTIDSRRMY